VLTVHLNSEGTPRLPLARLEEAVRRTLRDEGVERAELSVSFLDDADIRKLNREYLDRDRVTDVIAFTLGLSPGVRHPAFGHSGASRRPGRGAAADPVRVHAPPPLVGDVYIGVEQAERQAAELDIPFDEELVRLAIHGTLHVLGYDHPEGEGREESPLFRRQEALVREIMAADGPADERLP
jgi:probable rRNA maturation factor